MQPALTPALLVTVPPNLLGGDPLRVQTPTGGLIDVIIFNPPYVPTSAEEATQVCAALQDAPW